MPKHRCQTLTLGIISRNYQQTSSPGIITKLHPQLLSPVIIAKHRSPASYQAFSYQQALLPSNAVRRRRRVSKSNIVARHPTRHPLKESSASIVLSIVTKRRRQVLSPGIIAIHRYQASSSGIVIRVRYNRQV